jgi:hypothetical protein
LPHPPIHPRRKLPPAVKHGPVTRETADISGDACAGAKKSQGGNWAKPKLFREWNGEMHGTGTGQPQSRKAAAGCPPPSSCIIPPPPVFY